MRMWVPLQNLVLKPGKMAQAGKDPRLIPPHGRTSPLVARTGRNLWFVTGEQPRGGEQEHTTSQLHGGMWLPGRQTRRSTFKPPLCIESNWARPRCNETGELGLPGHSVHLKPKMGSSCRISTELSWETLQAGSKPMERNRKPAALIHHFGPCQLWPVWSIQTKCGPGDMQHIAAQIVTLDSDDLTSLTLV